MEEEETAWGCAYQFGLLSFFSGHNSIAEALWHNCSSDNLLLLNITSLWCLLTSPIDTGCPIRRKRNNRTAATAVI